jgi:peptidoglycan/LPS O-acetylase OafA/YrhL
VAGLMRSPYGRPPGALSSPKMAVFKAFGFKIVRFYGGISYSFYLLHALGMLFAFRAIDRAALSAMGLPRYCLKA